MDNLLGLLGLMFFMFLVLAAAVEVILEVFRGLFDLAGIGWFKSTVSLEDALQLAKEFAPDDKDLTTKLKAVETSARQIAKSSETHLNRLSTIKTELDAVAGGNLNDVAAKLNEVASSVKDDLAKNERRRIFWLRLIAAVVGCILAYASNFYVFQMLADAPEAADLLANLPGLQAIWINVLVGGLAAAAGSSYWHDQLDKIRNVKAAGQALRQA